MKDLPIEDFELFWVERANAKWYPISKRQLTEEQLRQFQAAYDSDTTPIVPEYAHNVVVMMPWNHPITPAYIVENLILELHQKKQIIPERYKKKTRNPIDLKTLDELKKNLSEDKTIWSNVFSYLSATADPWSTSEWRKRRNALIGNQCAHCGSGNPPFTLQHLQKLPKPETYLQHRRKDLQGEWMNWSAVNPAKTDTENIPKDTNGCPRCKSAVITFRKTKGSWKCNGMTNGEFCHHIFTEPISIADPRAVDSLMKKVKQENFETFLNKTNHGKRIMLEYIDAFSRYLKFENTATFCKRCAFVADKTDFAVCSICKIRLHPKIYASCKECASMV